MKTPRSPKAQCLAEIADMDQMIAGIEAGDEAAYVKGHALLIRVALDGRIIHCSILAGILRVFRDHSDEAVNKIDG